MIKNPAFFIFLFTAVSLQGQTFKLETSNPCPRVGSEVEISFRLEREVVQSDHKQNDMYKLFNRNQDLIGSGEFKLSSRFVTEMGPLHIGPFQISIDNTVYTTNSMILNVQDQLPNDIAEGVWIQLVTLDSVNYVVLEQRTPAIEKHTEEGTTSTWSTTIPEIDWAFVSAGKLSSEGVELKQKNSLTTVHTLDNGKSVGYKLTVYTYKLIESFKGKLKITRYHVEYLPPKAHFESH